MKDRSCSHCGVDLYKTLVLASCSIFFVSVATSVVGYFSSFWPMSPFMVIGCFIFGFTFLGMALAAAHEFDQKNEEAAEIK